MQLVKSLVLTSGLAALVVTGSALAHCGSCGVGGAKKKEEAHGHGHDHDHAHGHEKKAQAKGWMSGAKGQRKAPTGGVTVGAEAPGFTLLDQAGTPVKLKDLAGSVVVLEWTNPGCPYVVRHYAEGTMKDLQAKWAGEGVKWLTINSTNTMDREANAAFAQEHELPWPVLADPSGRVGRAYGAKTTPHMFVIAPDGTVAYAGAIDDDPRGEKDSRVNYVDAAIEAVLAGEAVATPETKSYGCSVKYP